jgi:hypothetical protein
VRQRSVEEGKLNAEDDRMAGKVDRRRMGRVERWGDLYMSYEGGKHMGNRGENDDENRRVFLNHKKEEKWRGRGVAGRLVQKQGCEGCQQLT